MDVRIESRRRNLKDDDCNRMTPAREQRPVARFEGTKDRPIRGTTAIHNERDRLARGARCGVAAQVATEGCVTDGELRQPKKSPRSAQPVDVLNRQVEAPHARRPERRSPIQEELKLYAWMR